MPDHLSKKILTHIADRRYEPRQAEALAKDLGVRPDQLELFRETLDRLIHEGQVVLGSSQMLALPPPGPEMVGTFRGNKRGFGFIVPNSMVEHGDLFVPASRTGGAMNGDIVRARVCHEARRGRQEGKSPYTGSVVEIIQRSDRRYVGQLAKRGSLWVVMIDGDWAHPPAIVRDPDAKNAKAGNKVVIELVTYPDGRDAAECVITEVLGKNGEPDVETRAIMRTHGLEEKFPDAVQAEAREAVRSFDASKKQAGREDLTGRFICTIDPPDAKDYDDAIGIDRLDAKREKDGAAYELSVHIADVSAFVPIGSALDEEARARGNSVYLPRRVIPMLPEVLSNGVCSLQEGVPRFCKSAFLRFDAEGKVVGQRFANTVIQSAKRLTYLEAQALIDGDQEEAARHTKSESGYPAELKGCLEAMNELAIVLRRRRMRDGMIVLELPEVELIYDDDGRVINAEPEDDAFTHKIIEMFMVQANEAAARLFDGLEVPAIRRVHPDPQVYSMKELGHFARVAGYTIPERPTRFELQGLLKASHGKPAQRAIHMAVLRTLSRAEYSPAPLGHFALASEHYTHFTSPIRRYTDLLIHRLLDAYLEVGGGEPGAKAKAVAKKMADHANWLDEPSLVEAGKHCSSTERNAEQAERSLRNYLVLDLLSRHVGDEFEGTVTGVTGSGVFVQLDRYLVDGFVAIAELPGFISGVSRPRWNLNRRTGQLEEQTSGVRLSLGDRFVVRVVLVEPAARRLDLAVMKQVGGGPGQGAAKGKKKAKKTKKGAKQAKPAAKKKRARRR